MRKIVLTTLLCLILPVLSHAGGPLTPDGTYLYARKDTCELFLDVYEPAKGSCTTVGDKEKPTVLFMFGGGFAAGRRDSERYLEWFSELSSNGYRVISIDYRLGLKGVNKVGAAQVGLLDRAIHLAVEDLFSATCFLMENAETLGIDPGNIVISGSSAGALTAMQAEYEICNRTSWASVLPEGFNYAGVMSFAGAILSRSGELRFPQKPCPMMILHGTADKTVPYKQIKVGRNGLFGGRKIAARLGKFGWNYDMYSYTGKGHEVSEYMSGTSELQYDFLENVVMGGLRRTLDSHIKD